MNKILGLQFICSLTFGAATSFITQENPLKDIGLDFTVQEKLSDNTWYGQLSYSYLLPGTKETRNSGTYAIVRKIPYGQNKYTIVYVDDNPNVKFVQGKPQKSTKVKYPKMPKGLFRESTGLIIGPNYDRYDWSNAKKDWINARTGESISNYRRYVHPTREVDQAFNSSKNRN